MKPDAEGQGHLEAVQVRRGSESQSCSLEGVHTCNSEVLIFCKTKDVADYEVRTVMLSAIAAC